jgi:hypothetical protein
MPRVWKLIAYITPMGSGVPLRVHFLVAIDDRDQAIKALWIHRGLGDALIENRGEASQLLTGWIEVEDGPILSVMAHPP